MFQALKQIRVHGQTFFHHEKSEKEELTTTALTPTTRTLPSESVWAAGPHPFTS